MSALGDLFTDIATEIRGKTGETGTMKPAEFPDKIAGIETGVEVTPDYVGFATFMNGGVELYKMPFIKGYDCPNPLTEGLIETPTKESTVSTNYTYSGWDNNLTDLTEDVVVNPVFSESVRYYTVTFYDDDGTTVLATQEVQYGVIPNYVPSKTGFSFKGWTTDLAPVTGDTSYVAVWGTVVTFATSSWSDISAVCEAGEAEDYFALGDTRTEYLTKDGTSYACTLKIIGFSHDDKSDGSGKAGITVAFFRFPIALSMNTLNKCTSDDSAASYSSSQFKYYIDVIQSYASSDLQAVLKSVNKPVSNRKNTTISNLSCKFFALSCYECKWNYCSNFYDQMNSNEKKSRLTGTVYQFFNENSYFGDTSNTETRFSSVEYPTNYKANYLWCRDVFYNGMDPLRFTTLSIDRIYSVTSASSNTHLPALAFCV